MTFIISLINFYCCIKLKFTENIDLAQSSNSRSHRFRSHLLNTKGVLKEILFFWEGGAIVQNMYGRKSLHIFLEGIFIQKQYLNIEWTFVAEWLGRRIICPSKSPLRIQMPSSEEIIQPVYETSVAPGVFLHK